MSKVTQALSSAIVGIGLVLVSGCVTSQPQTPLSYVALTRPAGPIKTTGQKVNTKHSRGGPYFLNAGFRAAPDIGAYIGKAQADAGADVLKNADVQLGVPFAIDILMFGFQIGSDTVKANQ